MVQVKKITLTPANIYALYATPQLALAAPANGYVNNILGVSHDMEYVSAPYTGAAHFLYGASASTFVYDGASVLPATVDVNLPAKKSNSTNCAFSTTKDFFVTTDAAAAAGDSPVDAYIVFETVPYIQ